MAAGGGTPVDLHVNGWLPAFLPDGRRFLHTAFVGSYKQAGVYVGSVDGKESRRILPDVSGVVFAPGDGPSGVNRGHILFVRDDTLMALPFDASSAQHSGDVFPVAENVPSLGNYPVSASTVGVLSYTASGVGAGNQLVWMDRTGKTLGPVSAPGPVLNPAISPDEKSVIFTRDAGSSRDLWLRDLSRGTETRFTSDASINAFPLWSPKGDRIVFGSNRDGSTALYQKTSNGSGQDELLTPGNGEHSPTQWSRDGKFIVYSVGGRGEQALWVLPMETPAAERKPILFLKTQFNIMFGQLSPDSHWMAFTSTRSGKRDVYVRPFPQGEGEWTISISGGQAPRWRGDGKEMFFVAADGKMMAVPVKAMAGAKPSFEAGVRCPCLIQTLCRLATRPGPCISTTSPPTASAS